MNQALNLRHIPFRQASAGPGARDPRFEVPGAGAHSPIEDRGPERDELPLDESEPSGVDALWDEELPGEARTLGPRDQEPLRVGDLRLQPAHPAAESEVLLDDGTTRG